MGVDIMFKMRHNLDVSSVDVLARELQNRLGCITCGYINPMDIEILQELKLPYPEYNADNQGVNIYIGDEHIVARSLIAVYGDGAREQIANHPNYQYIINQIDEVNQGLYSYNIDHDTLMEFGKPNIWEITNDAISGSPSFGSDRWGLFGCALDHTSRSDNSVLSILMKSRKQLYEFIKPLMSDEYIYYHADQGEEEVLSWMNYFDDIPQFLEKIHHKIFNLSEYLLNEDSQLVYNNQDVEYVILDDFKDLQ